MLFKRFCIQKIKENNLLRLSLLQGFSLAEMLVVMLILMIVVVASVPFVAPKKLKNKFIVSPHGIFECYYEGGNLYQYEMNNKTNKNGTTKQVQDACSVNIPNANFYTLQLVGAGGAGYKDKVCNYVRYDTNSGTTSIRNLSSLPSWVKNNWPGINLKVKMESPLGAGGKSWCDVDLKYNSQCNDYVGMANSRWPDHCKISIKKRGGDSGSGSFYEKTFPILPSDSIDYSATTSVTSFTHNGKTYALYPSGDGKNATKDKDGENGYDSYWSSSCAGVAKIKNDYINYGLECDSDFADESQSNESQAGSIDINPSEISYSQSNAYIMCELGENGKNAEVVNLTYPNLGNKTLTVIPAKTSSNETIVKIGNNVLASAKSGEDGSSSYAYTQKVENIESYNSNTSPLDYEPVNYKKIEKKLLLDNISDANLKSKIKDLNIYPGIAGVGSYPYIKTVNYNKKIVINNKNSSTPITINLDDSIKCYGGSDPKPQNYCSGVNGNSGAVRIVW